MATKIHHQSIPGLTDLLSLIRLIQDSETYSKLAADLDSKVAEVNKAIEGYGKIGDIDGALAKAVTAERNAATALSDANNRSAEILRSAQSRADEILSEAMAAAKTARDASEAKAVELGRLVTEAANRLSAVEKRETDVEQQERDVARMTDDAKRLKGEYEGKLSRLNAAMT